MSRAEWRVIPAVICCGDSHCKQLHTPSTGSLPFPPLLVMSGSVPTQDTFVLDTITIEPVPQKKGLILRHVEYIVKSEHFRSEVSRRYSDFQALNDLLLYRYSEVQYSIEQNRIVTPSDEVTQG